MRVLTASILAAQIALMQSMRTDDGGVFVVSNPDHDPPPNPAKSRPAPKAPAPATIHHETRQQRRAEERRAKKGGA